MSDLIADEDILFLLVIVDRSDLQAHSIARHHVVCLFGRLLDVAGCACRNVPKDNLLCNPATQRNHDLL